MRNLFSLANRYAQKKGATIPEPGAKPAVRMMSKPEVQEFVSKSFASIFSKMDDQFAQTISKADALNAEMNQAIEKASKGPGSDAQVRELERLINNNVRLSASYEPHESGEND